MDMKATDPALTMRKEELTEWDVRVQLAAAYRLVAHYGWDDLIFTHLSARVPGPEHHFLLNPYGLMFHEITASSLVKVDKEGNAVDGAQAGRINPAGFTIHSAVHMAREEAGAVMHLHEPNGVAVSAQKDGLLPLSQTAMLCLPHIAHHEYEGVALNLDERERLIRDLGDKQMMLLWNHGVLAVGESVPECFGNLYFFTKACEIQIRAGHGPYHLPSKEAIETTAMQSKDGLGGAGKLAWPGLIRLLDERLPGYRD
ncbi:MAG: class II aldolase/adducin family protein [Ectothiorhodospiraceae bacterium]|nr:class II aldolase/adducin family protein [Ectothiorhodospiraceae bacterium]